MIKNTPKNILIFLFLASSAALIGAYISQYYFGMQPCTLCFWQRYPFFAIIALTGLFLVFSFLKNFLTTNKQPQSSKYQKITIKIATLFLTINAGIAFYHSGVERKIFEGLGSCSSISGSPASVEELHRMLMATKAVLCDQPQFIFLNLSMAEWNLAYCLILIFAVIISLRKKYV